jgi:hypothetical protein
VFSCGANLEESFCVNNITAEHLMPLLDPNSVTAEIQTRKKCQSSVAVITVSQNLQFNGGFLCIFTNDFASHLSRFFQLQQIIECPLGHPLSLFSSQVQEAS